MERKPVPPLLTLGLPGCTVQVRSASPEASVALTPLYPFHRLSHVRPPDLAYTLLKVRLDGGCAWSVYEDGSLVAEACPTQRLSETLERRITTMALERQQGSILLHAAAIASREACAIFPGGSGVGKTTLVMALRELGCQVLGDDILLLDPNRRTVRAYPRSFLIKPSGAGTARTVNGAARQTRLAAFPDIHGNPSAARALPVEWVVFLDIGRRRRPEMLHVGDAESLRRLLHLSDCRRVREEAAFGALSALVREAGCHRLRYSEAGEGAEALLRFLTRAARDGRSRSSV